MKKIALWAMPLVIFLAVVVFLFFGLRLDNRAVESPLLGKAAPAFELAVLGGGGRVLSSRELLGQVWILNVWASWCAPCRVENPFLLRLKGEGAVIVGLSYKDAAADAAAFLRAYGSPFAAVVVDDGVASLDWGVYGVPETFVVDAAGILRYKHVGPVTEFDLREEIRPLLVELRAEAQTGVGN